MNLPPRKPPAPDYVTAQARALIRAADAGDKRAQATIVSAVSLEPENRTAFQQAIAREISRDPDSPY